MNQYRLITTLVAATLGGLLSVSTLVAYTVIVADMGQKTFAHAAPSSPVPPKSAFTTKGLSGVLAPWFFVLGFVGVLVPAESRRR